MKSILSVSLAATVLLYAFHATADPISRLSSRQTVTYPNFMGCYNSAPGLTNHGADIYQTKGYCLNNVCGPIGNSVEATSNRTDCWCGNSLPPASAKVATTYCNVDCAGYGKLEQCGGNGYFSVYETGFGTVEDSGSSASSSSVSSAVPQTTSTPTTSATPSVVTIGGRTFLLLEQYCESNN
jgi:cell wall integrity and stress response component